MKHFRTRTLLAGAEAEARGDGDVPLSATLSSRWESLLAVLRDANADMLLHASVLSLLAATGYALADVSRAFLSLHPRFTSTLYVAVVRPPAAGETPRAIAARANLRASNVVRRPRYIRPQAAAYVVDAVIYLMSWQGNACVCGGQRAPAASRSPRSHQPRVCLSTRCGCPQVAAGAAGQARRRV